MNKRASLLTKQYESYRRLTFILLIAFAIIFGILDIILYYQNGSIFFPSLIVNILTRLVLILLWCNFDSGVRRRRFRFNEGLLIVVLGIVGIPAYFWKTRSPKEFFISLGGLFLHIIPAVTQYMAVLATVKVMQFLGYFAS